MFSCFLQYLEVLDLLNFEVTVAEIFYNRAGGQ